MWAEQFVSFLNFFTQPPIPVAFFISRQKSKYSIFKKFFLLFFCLDTKEPKNQGKHERSAHFALPTPHIAFSNQIRPYNNELGSFV